MLTRLIRWSVSRPWLVAFIALSLLLIGAWWVRDIPVEIFPRLNPAQTVVQTEAPGLVAEQVEQLVTRPVENALGGIPGVAGVRSESVQGLSVITLDMARGAQPGAVRQAVAERLAAAVLPQGFAAPRIAPLTATTGDVLKIGFTSDKLDPMALRSVIQFTVRPRLLATAGVANVALYGGSIRRLEVRARPGDLVDSDLGFADVLNAVRRATSVAGAGFMDTPEQRVTVDSRGQALSAEDVGAGQIQTPGAAPVRIGDVADVMEAPAPATGDALINGKPGVLAEVSAAYGANTFATTHAVETTLDLLRPVLAAQGVSVRADLDRPADFIVDSMRTLGWDLAIGVGLIAVVLVISLRDLRAALLCLLPLPLSLLASLLTVKLLGLSLNAMTLGGLFVGLGVAIDDAVIDVENILGRLREAEDDPDHGHDHGHANRPDAVLHALMDVRAPVIYATLLIALALMPMLFARGAFGALAAPLALSALVAAIASLVVSVCLTPALALLLLHHVEPIETPRVFKRARAGYAGWVRRTCRRPALALIPLAIAAGLSAFLLWSMPRAGLPSFHDRHLVVDLDGPPAASPEAMRRVVQGIANAALRAPGVDKVTEHSGRDPTGFLAAAPDHAELELALDDTLNATSQDKAAERLRTLFAGYPDVRAQVRPRLTLRPANATPAVLTVNVFGENLDDVDQAAGQVASALKAMGGSKDIAVAGASQSPSMRIDLNFKRLALYGLSAGDVQDTMQAVLEGKTVAQVFDNGRAIDLAVTGPEAIRHDPEAIGDLLIRSSSGVSAPLKQVANVYLTEGRNQIQHEAGQRRETVAANPVSGDGPSFAKRAQAYLAAHVSLPRGVYLTYDAPDAEDGADARNVLIGGAIAGLAMVGLLVLALHNGRVAGLVLLSTAFSFAGGALAALLAGGTLSLGSLAGFVALFGLSTRNAVLLVTPPHEMHHREGAKWTLFTVSAAAAYRAGPILLTTVLIAVGVTPLLFTSAQAGGELLGPMAVVLVGGLISGAVLTLLFLPALIYAYSRPVDEPGESEHVHQH